MHPSCTYLPARRTLLLIFLASICANGCTEDSKENNTPTPSGTQNMNTCTSNAMCATRIDGLTKCDLIKGVCVAPETETKTECTSDADCSSRTDGKTQCDTSLHQCAEPSGSSPKCISDIDCSFRIDGKTKCDTSLHQCVNPANDTPECTTDADCDSRSDGKTQCDTSLHQCVEPANDTQECTTDADCDSRSDGKTQCDILVHQCVLPEAQEGICGDDQINSGEACDGLNLNGKTCADLDEYVDGTLSCDGSCQLDTSECVQCTDDDLSLCKSSQTCSSGYCVDPGHKITCGDGLVEGDEQCDDTNLKGKSCADFEGFVSGELKCQSCSFDTSDCLECTKDADCANRTDGKTICTANVCTKSEVSGSPKLVISQIYTGGGNSGAIYNTKYIELFNSGTSEADISGWSLQYGVSNKDTISGSPCILPNDAKLPSGGYYLVALNMGTNGEALPAPDHTCSMNPAAAKGKLFLVDNDAALESSTPSKGYIDAIGYGAANWSEGDNPVASLSATTAALRKNDGCTDTDNNGNDFDVSEPDPRNSHSPVNVCQGSVTPEEPACGNDKLDSGEDCDGSLFVDDKTSCSAWDSKYSSGSVSCNKCKIDYSGCSTAASECTDDEAECIEKDLSLKKCVNGKFVIEKCPNEKPYCKTDAEGCSLFQSMDFCNSNIFIPHSGLDSIYICPLAYYYEIKEGKVDRLDCGTNNCMQAKRGYGVATGNAEACDTKGQIRIIAHFSHSFSSSYKYYSCQKCKVNQEGALYWLYVPATYSIEGKTISCEPWDDIE